MKDMNLKINRCRYRRYDFEDNVSKCRCGGGDYDTMKEITPEICEKCDKFNSLFIEYPITVDKVEIKQPEAWNISFSPVKVRLCEDNKTYFGILLGELPWFTNISYDEETKILNVSTIDNPCIYVPELNRLVFGAESWWSRIESDEEISDITDLDINNTWYVKLLSGMIDKKGK